MKKLLTMIFILIFIKAKAQTPTWQWARSAQSTVPGWGEGWCAATDSLENIYYAGTYSYPITFGSFTLSNANYPIAIFLTKYDSSGNELWAKGSSGTNCWESGIATDKFSNCFIIGRYYYDPIAFDNDSLTNAGLNDIFLVKYDSSGNVQWSKGIGGINEDFGNAVATDASGNIYITGFFASPTITFGSFTLVNAGGINIFLVKYDTNGNVIWARSAGGTTGDRGDGITTDAFANVYLTGYVGSPISYFGSDSIVNSSTPNFFIAKYDSSGNVLWVKNSTGVGHAAGYGVATDAIGNIYSTGYFDSLSISFGSVNLTTTTSNNFFVVKYNSLGNALWARCPSGTNTTLSYNIVADANGNSYISGKPYGFTSPIYFDTVALQPPVGAIDAMFIVKYDSCGHAIYARALPSGGDDNNAVALGNSGNLYVVGDFIANPFIVGNDSLIPTGNEDAFIAKLSNSMSASICSVDGLSETTLEQNINAFPNPFTNLVSVKTNDNEQSQIILYDVFSRELLMQSFTNTTTLNTTQLASGIYIYKVRNKNGVLKQGKLVKE